MIDRYTHEETAKIWTDQNRFQKWLDIEVAVCNAWAELNEIPCDAAKRIREKSKVNLNRIRELEAITKHEVVAFVNSIIEQIGQDGSYFHRGITSSDIMDTAFSIMMRDSIDVVIKEIDKLMVEVKKKAVDFKDLACVGRTHGIHAEPMSFGLKFVSWYDELKRNRVRLVNAKQDVSVCIISGAVGTYSALDPKIEEMTAKELGLHIIGITTQVVPRDIYAEAFNALAMCGACMERISFELRHLQRTEVMEIMEEFTKGQTGSSVMPHKRNPISAENITGCARMLRSYAGVAMENIALWHERDISHSSAERIIGPDATVLASYMLKRLSGIISRLKVIESNVKKNLNLTHGLVYSSFVLVELMRKGMKRDDAY
ncbi:MAG: adenylosuccinate lyase, partial [Proteobacteria bacterium]|nr:adenylosuccinate lyase [Pseudomonadota bacterium]